MLSIHEICSSTELDLFKNFLNYQLYKLLKQAITWTELKFHYQNREKTFYISFSTLSLKLRANGDMKMVDDFSFKGQLSANFLPAHGA